MRGALRATSAPAASESSTQGRQFYADETPMPGDRRRSGEIASGSLPFTVTGDRFSAPSNNWFGSRAICGPSFTSSLLMVTSTSSSVASSSARNEMRRQRSRASGPGHASAHRMSSSCRPTKRSPSNAQFAEATPISGAAKGAGLLGPACGTRRHRTGLRTSAVR
jgi:hypothetical protein